MAGLGAARADALRGSWRSSPPALDIAEERLAALAPGLLKNGEAGLVWRRLDAEARTHLPSAGVLHDAYRFQALRAAVRMREIAEAVGLLRSGGVEPLLIKGWAIARLYPDAGLRPTGDIDICVRADQLEAARAALRRASVALAVDLHAGAPTYGDRTMDDLLARSELVEVEGTDVRIPGAPDHLRLLCLHLLSHGAWRPVWLCDVAAAVEARAPEFRWEDCLSGNPRHTQAVACVIGLAQRLLGADLAGTPLCEGATKLPRWLVPAVLRQWEHGLGASGQGPLVNRLPDLLRRPGGLRAELRLRWRNPIQASFELGAPFNGWPRLPFQLLATLRRAPAFARQVSAAFTSR
jgi:Uncharacterised nucleotidyltransferase